MVHFSKPDALIFSLMFLYFLLLIAYPQSRITVYLILKIPSSTQHG